MPSTIKLTELIVAWDTLPGQDTARIDFCDLANALAGAGIKIVNDVACTQPEVVEEER